VYRSPVTARPDSWFCIFPWQQTSMNMSLRHLEVFQQGYTRRLAEMTAESSQRFPRNKKKRDDAAVADRKQCRLDFAGCVQAVDFLQPDSLSEDSGGFRAQSRRMLLHHGLLHPFTSTAKRYFYAQYALACQREQETRAPIRLTATSGKALLMKNFKKHVRQQRDELWWTDWDRVLGMVDEIFGETSCDPLLLLGKLLKLATSIGSAGRDEMKSPGNRALREMLLQCVLVGMRGALMCTPVEGKTSEWGKIFSVHFEAFSVMYDECMGEERAPECWQYAPGDWDEETTEAAVRTARTHSSRMGSTLKSYHDSFNTVCALREHGHTLRCLGRFASTCVC
jgi:hypothetical protein